MYQIAVVANKTRSLPDAVQLAKGFMDYGIIDLILEPQYEVATQLYYATQIETLAVYPIHIMKEGDVAYYAIVTRLSGHVWVDEGAQVLFVGDEYEEYLNEDAMSGVINHYARQPANRLNRARLDELMATVLGPIFSIVPPTGLNEAFSVAEIREPSKFFGTEESTGTSFALSVVTKSVGILDQVSDIYNLVDKMEKPTTE